MRASERFEKISNWLFEILRDDLRYIEIYPLCKSSIIDSNCFNPHEIMLRFCVN